MPWAFVSKREHDPFEQRRRAAVRTAISLIVLALALYVGYFLFMHYLH